MSHCLQKCRCRKLSTANFAAASSCEEEQTKTLLAAVGLSLKDTCPHVCARAMAALNTTSRCSRNFKLQVALPTTRLLNDEDRFVRARAVCTLGRLGEDVGGVADLLSLRCQDSSPEVQQLARSVLLHLKPLALEAFASEACQKEIGALQYGSGLSCVQCQLQSLAKRRCQCYW